MTATELPSRPAPDMARSGGSGSDSHNRFGWALIAVIAILGLAAAMLIGLIAFVVGAVTLEAGDPPANLAPPVESSEPASPAPAESCSATGYASPSDQAGLPEAVAAKRAAILAAAADCDLTSLADLTDELFVASFGGGDAFTIWSEAEARGGEPVRFLVELLDQPYGVMQSEDGEFYVWPNAFLSGSWAEVSEADRAGLATVYSQDQLSSFEDFGAYIGYRIAIHETGDWIYFVAGD